jgi:hypothetical protein
MSLPGDVSANRVKKIPSLLIVVICMFCSNAMFGQTGSVTQSWNEVQLILPLLRTKDDKGKSTDRLTATFFGILRLGRTSHFEDQRTGVMLEYRVNRHLSLGTAVLYRKDENVKFFPRLETRFDVGGTLSTTWNKFSIKDRNVYEHRFRNGRVNTDFYRQRIQISRPLKRGNKTLFTPFISEEGYYQFGASRWVQNEFYAGISRRLSPRTVLDIAYLRNDVKPVNVNGLSLTLKITLR